MCDPITLSLAGIGAALGGAAAGGTAATIAAGAAIGGATATGLTYAGKGVVKGAKSLLGGKSTKEPVKTPELAKTPTQADASVRLAGQEERRRAAALGGYIKTSSQGLGGVANTQKKKLLGQ